MASHKAHHLTGWAAGVIAAALVVRAGAGGPYYIWGLASLIAGLFGATAPDWLEVAWWSRRRRLWITHRTWTHWGVAWIALLSYSYQDLPRQHWAPMLFGFAAGGLMHLLADWPNPLGVPWLIGRHSLKLWKSGRCDWIVIGLAWLGAFLVADHVFWHDIHTLRALTLLRTFPH